MNIQMKIQAKILEVKIPNSLYKILNLFYKIIRNITSRYKIKNSLLLDRIYATTVFTKEWREQNRKISSTLLPASKGLSEINHLTASILVVADTADRCSRRHARNRRGAPSTKLAAFAAPPPLLQAQRLKLETKDKLLIIQ